MAGCSLPFSPGPCVLRLEKTLESGHIFFFPLCPFLAVMGTPLGIQSSFSPPLNNQPLSESELWVFLDCLFNPLEVLWDHFPIPIPVHNSLLYRIFHKYISLSILLQTVYSSSHPLRWYSPDQAWHPCIWLLLNTSSPPDVEPFIISLAPTDDLWSSTYCHYAGKCWDRL